MSCIQKEELSLEELRKYPFNPENGLIKTAQKNGLTFNLIFKPKSSFAPQQDIGVQPLSKTSEESIYFLLSISDQGKEIEGRYVKNPNNHKAIISYLASGISQDIMLRAGEHTFWPKDMIYTPSYGTTKATLVLFVFDAKALDNDDLIFCFNDRFFETGRTEFQFDVNDLKSIPKLKI